VLGLVVTERLYRDHPDLAEGSLAKMRAACVSQRALAEVARELDLGPFILLGKGEIATIGLDKDSILCDALEAVLGAMYLSNGIDATRAAIERLLAPSLARAAQVGAGLDWKTSLQEACAARGLGSPSYEVEGLGPDHLRTFTATVMIGGVAAGSGHGSAKKHAEQEAAAVAYAKITADTP